MICDPNGQIVIEMDEKAGLLESEIDLNLIHKIRKRMPYASIQRNDLYEIKEKKNEDNFN